MTLFELALAHAVKVVLVATLVGALARRRARECYSFVLYLVVILIGNTLVSLWPERFLSPGFWSLKQAVYDVVKLAVALELAYRALRAFPGASQVARVALLALLMLSTSAILALPRDLSFAAFVMERQPRILLATIWLLTVTAALVAWFRVPVSWWHRAIVIGFAGYLLVFVTLLNVLRELGLTLWRLLDAWSSAAYLALTCWWAYAAWRSEERVVVPREVARRLGWERA